MTEEPKDADESSVDDWESHWSEYADSASDNPAQEYRRQLIMDLARRQSAVARVLDVGSGQGDLLASLRDAWPDAELAGIELSAEGVRRAQAKVPSARFWQLDLLAAPVGAPELVGWADVAVCSEVLEHVDQPSVLLAAAARFVAPDGVVIVTVPGGPRTAFDRHIGHRRHYRPAALRTVIEGAGLDVEFVRGAGFPFFNAYKLLVLLRGKALVRDVSASAPPSRVAATTMRVFRTLLQPRRNASHLGWQTIAVARLRPSRPPPAAGLDESSYGREHDVMNKVMDGLRIKIFADGANLEELTALAGDPRIAGFTTNPTLMRRAGVSDYARFVKELTTRITDRPISFEVFSDDFAEMERQALALREFGENVFVKIPITDTTGTSAAPLMARLAAAGVSINATALMTLAQVREVAVALRGGPPAVVSVFAGRIADAGIEPEPVMREAKLHLAEHPNLELLWASPREVLNVLQAERAGCDIITVTPDLLLKCASLGRDLDDFSLATVRMFRDDAVAARYEF